LGETLVFGMDDIVPGSGHAGRLKIWELAGLKDSPPGPTTLI